MTRLMIEPEVTIKWKNLILIIDEMKTMENLYYEVLMENQSLRSKCENQDADDKLGE
jgi:hypothetical protein